MKVEPVAWHIHPRDHKHGFISEDKNSAIVCEDTSDITPLYAIPPGYALVRVEPDGKMWSAGRTALRDVIDDYEQAGGYELRSAVLDRGPEKILEAMLTAAKWE